VIYRVNSLGRLLHRIFALIERSTGLRHGNGRSVPMSELCKAGVCSIRPPPSMQWIETLMASNIWQIDAMLALAVSKSMAVNSSGAFNLASCSPRREFPISLEAFPF
jgi:hypothetical protein